MLSPYMRAGGMTSQSLCWLDRRPRGRDPRRRSCDAGRLNTDSPDLCAARSLGAAPGSSHTVPTGQEPWARRHLLVPRSPLALRVSAEWYDTILAPTMIKHCDLDHTLSSATH